VEILNLKVIYNLYVKFTSKMCLFKICTIVSKFDDIAYRSYIIVEIALVK